ncbi:MAG TPA: septum site-determining protein MinC [Kofleriaceae bacterium]|nr:septum site-determining protein MinC [Kofleriaceae bacterium]
MRYRKKGMMSLPAESPTEAGADQAPPPVILRGGNAGLEIVISPDATVDEMATALVARLEQSPGFFAGNDASVRVTGRLPRGALARLEEITHRFDLRIVEIGPPRRAASVSPVPVEATLKTASPGPEELDLDVDVDLEVIAEQVSAPVAVLPFVVPAPAAPPAPKLIIGPVRSGVTLEASGDIVILGDVNPGAEILARGNIMVLGRLRGTACAAVGAERGFIMAIRLEPQQLRIGSLVARAGDSDSPGQSAEIAYANGRTIVVEKYQGRLPAGIELSAGSLL